MFDFLKKLFGLPTREEVEAAKVRAEAVPYKVETPVINNKTGDVVEVFPAPVNDQVTDTVTDTVTDVVTEPPAKKTRRPRTPKAQTVAEEKPVKTRAKKEKVAKVPAPAAKRTYTRKSAKI